MRLLSACAALALLVGCASNVLIPPEQRAVIDRELTGSDREQFLKLSYYVTPFFGDASKKLLTPVPPEEIDWLSTPGGETVNPGKVERVLPVGTRVRIAKVEFPTAWVMTERVLYTPRDRPWVYLQVEGEAAPLILVLRPQMKTRDEFLAELERYLTRQDPAPLLEGFSETVRAAVRSKTAVVDMPSEALEMAWGYPRTKRVTFEESVRKEEWRYAGNKRSAFLTEGRVVELKGGP